MEHKIIPNKVESFQVCGIFPSLLDRSKKPTHHMESFQWVESFQALCITTWHCSNIVSMVRVLNLLCLLRVAHDGANTSLAHQQQHPSLPLPRILFQKHTHTMTNTCIHAQASLCLLKNLIALSSSTKSMQRVSLLIVACAIGMRVV